jgi:hypothetical protein
MDKLPKKNLDIEQIIDKIKNLPIDDKDKATILEQIKGNIMNPSAGENKNLDDIQNKYNSINMPRIESQNQVNGNQVNGNNNQNSYRTQFIDQSQPMTVAHFEILKNKLDSLQYELIDLLRHVKDYTQRYMNAIRQQDLDKINEYITGLFEVDKTLKETQALAAENIEEVPEEEPEDRKGVISKATSGIKNFFGSIGDNVSGITNLVSNTTKIANDYLVKKVIPTSNTSNQSNQSNKSNQSNTSNTSNASNVSVAKTGNTSNNNTTTPNTIVKNKNIVSIEDYISDMNKLESINQSSNETKISSSIPNSNMITTSSNNINSLSSQGSQDSNKSNTATAEIKPDVTVQKPESSESKSPNEPKNESEKLEGALKKLNDEINKDIDNTINNTTQSGGKRTHKFNNNNNNKKINKKESNLTNKIKLLRLKLTKNKLQKQLSETKNGVTKKNKKR